MQPATQNFTARRLAISLTSANVSNALHIEGGGWEVADSNITQAGVCLWPPQSDNTDFSSSTTLLLHAATEAMVAPEHCVYVGDDLRDVQAGQAAGMRTVAAAYGYCGKADPPEAWGADHVISTPRELLDVLSV
jgi:histidinol phosphatase-like enzyme